MMYFNSNSSGRRLAWTAATLALLAFPAASQAQQQQGPINGAIGGAAQGTYEGKTAAGPIGGLVGGALGAGVGAVAGTLGVIGDGASRAVGSEQSPSPMPPPLGTGYDSGRR